MRKLAFLLLVAAAGVGLFSGGAHASDGNSQANQKHKVVEGETLSSIAQASNLDSWKPIWNANTQLTNPDMLNVNEDLTVPTGNVPDRPLPDGYGQPVVASASFPVQAEPVAQAAYTRHYSGVTQPASMATASGDLFARIRARESGGNYAINTGNGYYGAYQYNLATWNNFGGYARPDLAPPAVQDAKAQQTYAQRGCSPWPNTCY